MFCPGTIFLEEEFLISFQEFEENVSTFLSCESQCEGQKQMNTLKKPVYLCFFSHKWVTKFKKCRNIICKSHLKPLIYFVAHIASHNVKDKGLNGEAYYIFCNEIFQEVESEGVEIIFVSSDRSPADMISYMKESHGDWFAVEHGSEVGQGM